MERFCFSPCYFDPSSSAIKISSWENSNMLKHKKRENPTWLACFNKFTGGHKILTLPHANHAVFAKAQSRGPHCSTDTIPVLPPHRYFQITAGGRRDKLQVILLHLQVLSIRPAVASVTLIHLHISMSAWYEQLGHLLVMPSKGFVQHCRRRRHHPHHHHHHHHLHHLLLFLSVWCRWFSSLKEAPWGQT